MSYLAFGKHKVKALPDVFVPFVTDLVVHYNYSVLHMFEFPVLHRFVEQVEANSVAEDGEEAVEAKDERDRDEESVPEPEHQVDFLIDNVLKKEIKRKRGKQDLSEDAEPTVMLRTSTSTNVGH